MKIGLFGSRHQKKEQIERILNMLSENQVDIFLNRGFYEYLHKSFCLDKKFAGLLESTDYGNIDMAFSIGGDGTFLRTASLVGERNIPILGINTGRLGFLADLSEENLIPALHDLLQGKYCVENRTQLMLSTEEKSFKGYNYALNEIAILKQDSSSMITIHASLNGEYLTSYQADGLIISTPTGSTAYSLSVGGPIMTPSACNFIITAVAPHSLTTRPLVVEDNCIITLDVESRNSNFLVSLDGRSDVLTEGTRLEIKKGEYPLKVIKRIGHTFYGTLRDKLMWGADPRIV